MGKTNWWKIRSKGNPIKKIHPQLNVINSTILKINKKPQERKIHHKEEENKIGIKKQKLLQVLMVTVAIILVVA